MQPDKCSHMRRGVVTGGYVHAISWNHREYRTDVSVCYKSDVRMMILYSSISIFETLVFDFVSGGLFFVAVFSIANDKD